MSDPAVSGDSDQRDSAPESDGLPGDAGAAADGASEAARQGSDPVAPDDRAPSASELVGAALGGAARRAGLDPTSDATTGELIWKAIGGWRGAAETILPTLLFVIAFTLTKDLLLAVILSVGIAVVFTVARLIARQTVGAAIGGLIATSIAALWALSTGSATDAFVWGLIVNAVYGGALLISALVGWPIVGLAVGFLMGDGTAWRADRRKRRAFFWLTLAWAALFAVRLAVQLPFYFADDVAGLGIWKIVLGIPLFAAVVALSWYVVRRLYGARERS